MKINRRIIATLLLLLFLGMVLWVMAERCYDLERAACFAQLTGYTEQLGGEIRQTVESDRAYLERLSDLLAQYDLADCREVGGVLASLGGSGMISRLDVLLPGDRMLSGDGTLTDLPEGLSFQAEAAAGAHISRRSGDPLHPGSLVLRHCVPVVRDGETAAVLCGVVELSELPRIFPVKGYGDEVQFFLVEGTSGSFLADTRHDVLGTIADLGTRQAAKGYSWEAFLAGLSEGRKGTAVFHSENAGTYFYTYSTPVGVEDWMVALTVPEEAVFAQAKQILGTFYCLAALLLLFFGFYFLWLLWDIRREKATGERQLRHVRYMLDVEKELFDAHVHPEHFTTAMQKVADFLTAETAFFWLVEGQRDVRRRLWSNRDDQALEQSPELLSLLPGLFPILQERKGILSYQTADLSRDFPIGGKALSHYQIHSLMLISVQGLSGELSMILGACNMEHRWESFEPLEQISLCLSMAVGHYGIYQYLQRIGRLDDLTGLMNRNSYNAALEALDKEQPHSLTCVYIDANGLHELNNHLGHQAGDEMLKAIADVLRAAFPEGDVYRIGGDEFVVLCRNQAAQDVRHSAERAAEETSERGYALSVGIECREQDYNAREVVAAAERAMRQNKRKYYQGSGKERQMRVLNQQLERMLVEKQDADAFLEVLEPEFKGVYFVNLGSDTIRHIYIPSYFETILRETGDVFSEALLLYARRIAKPAYYRRFEEICDYAALEERLRGDATPEFVYQKKDGSWLKLRVLKFKNYTEESRETLWIFSNASGPADNTDGMTGGKES